MFLGRGNAADGPYRDVYCSRLTSDSERYRIAPWDRLAGGEQHLQEVFPVVVLDAQLRLASGKLGAIGFQIPFVEGFLPSSQIVFHPVFPALVHLVDHEAENRWEDAFVFN